MSDARKVATSEQPRIALIDLQQLEKYPPPQTLARLLSEAKDQHAREGEIWKLLVTRAAIQAPWAPPPMAPRDISLKPPAADEVRRAVRVLSMVHELHKAGYQRIQISPGLAPSGNYWRCNITFAGNIAEDGCGFLTKEEGTVAYYSSGSGSQYFGLPGVEDLNARELAVRFLSAYPLIAERGAGRDWLYAGWLTDVLGRAEQGRAEDFPVFYADNELDPEMLRAWLPPPKRVQFSE